MAKTKTTYLADDGAEFETEREADAHNAGLTNKARIDAYLDAAGLSEGAQRTLAFKRIAGFIAHEAAQA